VRSRLCGFPPTSTSGGTRLVPVFILLRKSPDSESRHIGTLFTDGQIPGRKKILSPQEPYIPYHHIFCLSPVFALDGGESDQSLPKVPPRTICFFFEVTGSPGSLRSSGARFSLDLVATGMSSVVLAHVPHPRSCERGAGAAVSRLRTIPSTSSDGCCPVPRCKLLAA
jgi:hypothetical protein